MRFIVPWGPLGPTKLVVCFHHQSPTGLHLLHDYSRREVDVLGAFQRSRCNKNLTLECHVFAFDLSRLLSFCSCPGAAAASATYCQRSPRFYLVAYGRVHRAGRGSVRQEMIEFASASDRFVNANRFRPS